MLSFSNTQTIKNNTSLENQIEGINLLILYVNEFLKVKILTISDMKYYIIYLSYNNLHSHTIDILLGWFWILFDWVFSDLI